MWREELPPSALRGADLVSVSGRGRLASTATWLDMVAGAAPSYCGPGATLHVLAAFDRRGVIAALPLVRTGEARSARPFPMDVEDLFFGLWTRHVPGGDPDLRRRALASRAFGAVLRRLCPSLRRGLILHAPLSPVSDALVSPAVSPSAAREAVGSLVARAREVAAAEDRCLLIPRLLRGDAPRWGESLSGLTRAATYPVAEIALADPPPARTRQGIRRNARLVERASITVEVTDHAPADVPFTALFEETARRHDDPVPRLDHGLFHSLSERFPGRVRFLCARSGGRVAGFVAALARGAEWEAWKCGVDRSVAGDAPVYLDLVYGRLRELAAREGAARVGLGAGEMAVKLHYGARVAKVDAYLGLPPSFLGKGAFEAYVRAVGEGIAREEPAPGARRPAGPAPAQDRSVATTPK